MNEGANRLIEVQPYIPENTVSDMCLITPYNSASIDDEGQPMEQDNRNLVQTKRKILQTHRGNLYHASLPTVSK